MVENPVTFKCGNEQILGILLDKMGRNGHAISKNFSIKKKYVEDFLKYDLNFKKIKILVGLVYEKIYDIVYQSLGFKIYNLIECLKKLGILEDFGLFFSKKSIQEEIISIILKWLK